MNPKCFALFVIMANVVAGCTQWIDTDTEDGISAETSSALIGDNALDSNGIDANGLLLNGIDGNGLAPQFLSSGAYTALTDPGSAGDQARMLYKYMVGCALDSTQSVSFTWTTSKGVVRNDVYWGSLGLAPTWVNASLTLSDRRWVSACIAARSNYYAVPVTISLRGPHAAIKHLGPLEQSSYPMEEGAFWGDLFDGTPQLYSCHKGTNVAFSRSKLRECAAGHVTQSGGIAECSNISIRGNCDILCDPIDPRSYSRPRCQDIETGTMTNDVVTVFLAP